MQFKVSIDRESVLAFIIGLGILVWVFGSVQDESPGKTYSWTRDTLSIPKNEEDAWRSPITSEAVLASLSGVRDPELSLSIVDLGLVYDIDIIGGAVEVTMTFTTPKCPMAATLIEDVRNALFTDPRVSSVELTITFDPPWRVDMMTAEARSRIMGVSVGVEGGQEEVNL